MSKKLENLEKLYGFKRGDGYSKYGATLEQREEMFNAVKNAGYKVKGDFEPNSNYIFRTKQMIFAPTNVGYHYFKRTYNALHHFEFMSRFTPVSEINENEIPKKLVFKSVLDNSSSSIDDNLNLDNQYNQWLFNLISKKYEKS